MANVLYNVSPCICTVAVNYVMFLNHKECGYYDSLLLRTLSEEVIQYLIPFRFRKLSLVSVIFAYESTYFQ